MPIVVRLMVRRGFVKRTGHDFAAWRKLLDGAKRGISRRSSRRRSRRSPTTIAGLRWSARGGAWAPPRRSSRSSSNARRPVPTRSMSCAARWRLDHATWQIAVDRIKLPLLTLCARAGDAISDGCAGALGRRCRLPPHRRTRIRCPIRTTTSTRSPRSRSWAACTSGSRRGRMRRGAREEAAGLLQVGRGRLARRSHVAGGADKFGHAWSTMSLARGGTELLSATAATIAARRRWSRPGLAETLFVVRRGQGRLLLRALVLRPQRPTGWAPSSRSCSTTSRGSTRCSTSRRVVPEPGVSRQRQPRRRRGPAQHRRGLQRRDLPARVSPRIDPRAARLALGHVVALRRPRARVRHPRVQAEPAGRLSRTTSPGRVRRRVVQRAGLLRLAVRAPAGAAPPLHQPRPVRGDERAVHVTLPARRQP